MFLRGVKNVYTTAIVGRRNARNPVIVVNVRGMKMRSKIHVTRVHIDDIKVTVRGAAAVVETSHVQEPPEEDNHEAPEEEEVLYEYKNSPLPKGATIRATKFFHRLQGDVTTIVRSRAPHTFPGHDCEVYPAPNLSHGTSK